MIDIPLQAWLDNDYSSLDILKVKYHANAENENPLKNLKKIEYVGQRLMYPIIEEEK